MRRRRDPVDTRVRLGPVTLPNPIVAASGTFGHGDELATLCEPAALGAVTVKSLAAFAWPGNPPLRVCESAGGGMLNSVGLAGPGVAAWLAQDLPRLRARQARVIVSIWGRTIEEFTAAAAPLTAVLDELVAVEVNASCPNLESRSRMFAHDPAATSAVVRAVVDVVGDRIPVLAKLSPNAADVRDIAAASVDAGATGLTLVNTLLGLEIDARTRRPRLGAGGGGYSGPPIKPVALRIVHEVHRAFPGVPIVGTGGVASGEDAVEMMLAGASAVGVGTVTFAEPRAPVRIRDEIVEWCQRSGTRRVADLTGALEPPA